MNILLLALHGISSWVFECLLLCEGTAYLGTAQKSTHPEFKAKPPSWWHEMSTWVGRCQVNFDEAVTWRHGLLVGRRELGVVTLAALKYRAHACNSMRVLISAIHFQMEGHTGMKNKISTLVGH